jgi:hypothetical protein
MVESVKLRWSFEEPTLRQIFGSDSRRFCDVEMRWQKLDDHCHRGQSAQLEISGMNELTNTIDEPEDQHESTYALLMRSEEKSRNLLEMLIYPLLIIGAMIAIWQFAFQPMDLPSRDTRAAVSVTSGQKLSVGS